MLSPVFFPFILFMVLSRAAQLFIKMSAASHLSLQAQCPSHSYYVSSFPTCIWFLWLCWVLKEKARTMVENSFEISRFSIHTDSWYPRTRKESQTINYLLSWLSGEHVLSAKETHPRIRYFVECGHYPCELLPLPEPPTLLLHHQRVKPDSAAVPGREGSCSVAAPVPAGAL